MTSHVSEQPAAASRQSPDQLEERLRELEDRVATLTEAVRALARGLEDPPLAGPRGSGRPEAARHAYDLLLAGQERERPS